ncbi:TIGR00297 family protein [Methanococcus voltae]|uniref:Uncharacterized protein (TIGR00297 family) n=2 Tax=Methanococcus voltae TaxID=2188 RepID=A0A8J7S528_METVO|nr:TIGR00297 family protein [Methanococcus voltae]MBP2172915.1 uncharacterized protein (TIGR00297 family) [Methanococcus voltae]MBP2201675.1 uncharacterized protein (TIGR00297 family) [Methanococcus voltae]MCS3922463.1 uncharacterized protein (TIGR00297 family) [Methanococcus voltae PS]
MILVYKFIISVFIIGLIAYMSHKKKFLDTKGIIGSSTMAFIIIMGTDITWLLVLISFLILGSLMSKVGYGKKDKLKMGEKTRSLKNVLANGLMPLIFVILYIGGLLDYPTALLGYLGSIAAANSDTFSSELGMVFGGSPRLITTFQKVEVGTDGGITFGGTFFGLIGSFTIGLIAMLLFGKIEYLGICTLSGIFGNFVDSLVGATFERRHLLNNEYVNFIATLAGGLFAIFVAVKVI